MTSIDHSSISARVTKLATDKYRVVIRNKEDVWYQRWVAKLLFFVPDYLERYSNAWPPNQVHIVKGAGWKTLAHEIQHVVDMRKLLFVFFMIYYYSPQILGAILGTAVHPWFFVLLAPLPSPGRLHLECRGYGVSLATRKWAGYSEERIQKAFDYYVDLLSESPYYFTMPIKPITRWALKRSYKNTLKRKSEFHQDLYKAITQ